MSGPKDDETTPDAGPMVPATSPPAGAAAATPDAADRRDIRCVDERDGRSNGRRGIRCIHERHIHRIGKRGARSCSRVDIRTRPTDRVRDIAPRPPRHRPRPRPPHPAASAVFPQPAVEPPSPDVAPVEAESALPGMHRGGFERWPTAPVGVMPIPSAPDLDAPVQWAAVEPTAPPRGMAAWALGFAIAALVVSLFVGWGFPIGLVAIVTAIIALRRPLESRAVAVWALVLGTVSVLYSAGWLLFAASRTDLLG